MPTFLLQCPRLVWSCLLRLRTGGAHAPPQPRQSHHGPADGKIVHCRLLSLHGLDLTPRNKAHARLSVISWCTASQQAGIGATRGSMIMSSKDWVLLPWQGAAPSCWLSDITAVPSFGDVTVQDRWLCGLDPVTACADLQDVPGLLLISLYRLQLDVWLPSTPFLHDDHLKPTSTWCWREHFAGWAKGMQLWHAPIEHL
jgi:hypothetical protein